MSFFIKNKICVTHDGRFHADDLFATAVLSILNNGNIEIIRTRNQNIIDDGDYVYDVGGLYDPGRDLFDHHQKGGAGARPNGVPYASFGLVWNKYGEHICGSREVANLIDEKIVCSIDAIDNGVDISKPLFKDIAPYYATQIFLAAQPTWKEDMNNIDQIFIEQVNLVVQILSREIEVAKSEIEAHDIIMNAYENAFDKRIIILDYNFPRYIFQRVLSSLPEPIYLISPSNNNTEWKVEAISESPETLNSRKPFPEQWRGMSRNDEEMEELEGVSDLIFCHKSGFLLHTISKESALKLAQKSLIA